MSLRGEPVEVAATLPDGRSLRVRVGVPPDPYLPTRALRTVAIELFERGRAVASATTLLDPEDTSEARELAREVAARLADGTIDATAASLERLADRG